MRIKYVFIFFFALSCLMTCHWWQTRKMPTGGPLLSSPDAAAQIFQEQNEVSACAKNLNVARMELDVSKDEFIKDITQACTNAEITLISRYWFCFSNQLICPLKWSAPYQKAGNNCRPLPKLSEKCCSYYSIEWLGENGKRHTSCPH